MKLLLRFSLKYFFKASSSSLDILYKGPYEGSYLLSVGWYDRKIDVVGVYLWLFLKTS